MTVNITISITNKKLQKINSNGFSINYNIYCILLAVLCARLHSIFLLCWPKIYRRKIIRIAHVCLKSYHVGRSTQWQSCRQNHTDVSMNKQWDRNLNKVSENKIKLFYFARVLILFNGAENAHKTAIMYFFALLTSFFKLILIFCHEDINGVCFILSARKVEIWISY